MFITVKTPHTEFRLEGAGIPQEFIETIKKTFGAGNVNLEDDDSLNVDDWDACKEFKKSITAGGNLRFYRKMHKLTQVQLAERIGSDKMMVSKMERNVIPISRKNALKFASLFKAGVQNFIL
ncbi:MAG: helix-turn-helix transcriptional regulator [Sphaerochaetaceae bacterium]|jgi:DNA-binding XRE family transcriptional regulator